MHLRLAALELTTWLEENLELLLPLSELGLRVCATKLSLCSTGEVPWALWGRANPRPTEPCSQPLTQIICITQFRNCGLKYFEDGKIILGR